MFSQASNGATLRRAFVRSVDLQDVLSVTDRTGLSVLAVDSGLGCMGMALLVNGDWELFFYNVYITSSGYRHTRFGSESWSWVHGAPKAGVMACGGGHDRQHTLLGLLRPGSVSLL